MKTQRGWLPPRSPYGLIQEDLWDGTLDGEWRVLVSCMFLNCTSRKQVEKVLPGFISRWPSPRAFVDADPTVVASTCRSLGFANRRTENLFKMTKSFLEGTWEHARQLPGIGEYGSRAWEIFCCGELGIGPPDDHALVRYHAWARDRMR